MSQHELSPEAARLLDRMIGSPLSHSRFAGAPIRWEQTDALALGDLWTTAQMVSRAERHTSPPSIAGATASAIHERAKDMEPAFRGSACRDYLDMLAGRLEDTADKTLDHFASFECEDARFALLRCIDLTFDDLGRAAGRFLSAMGRLRRPHFALALARLAGCEARILEQLSADLAGSPIAVEELRVVAALDIAIGIAVDDSWYPSPGKHAPSGFDRLSEAADYAAFAETALRRAAERVRQIHDRTVPYASDKAFTREEAYVLAHLSRVALSRDEAWLPSLLDALFRDVSLAPGAAKSLPSQAVAIALGHAVEAFPTPEAVATLRAVLRDIRHAGVKKKLQRNLSGAERGLADRPQVALRLPADQPASKQQLTTLARALEAGLATGMVLAYADWRGRLGDHPHARAIACALVWRVLDPGGAWLSVLPTTESGGVGLRDDTGALVPVSEDCQVKLWHPSEAIAAERDAWRDRLAALRIKQPFKQVFREYYTAPDDELTGTATAMFAGHSVAVIPLLGLARREQWQLEDDSLTRIFDRWTARLELADSIFPGRGGGTTTQKLSLWAISGQRAVPVRLGDLPPVMLSEIMRAVDLLVSVSGFAVIDDPYALRHDMHLWRLAETPLGKMAEMRKRALHYALRGLDGVTDLQFDARHLRLGHYAIHLATGRVTRDGDPITIDLPKRTKLAAMPWLPYDEKLLETIYYTAIEIASRNAGQ